MREPNWLSSELVMAVHERQLAEHGGGSGVRDVGLFESALDRAKNTFYYSKDATLFDLAANYAFGIIKNHPFIDGNKRTGFVAAALFLAKNNYELNASEEGAYDYSINLADGSISEKEFSDWLKNNSTKL